jgi:hypothetical protein
MKQEPSSCWVSSTEVGDFVLLRNNGEIIANLVAWVRERIMPKELPTLVGEVSANFYG